MTGMLRGRIGVKVSVIVNSFILLVMALGTWFLVERQQTNLEAALKEKGRTQSMVGAKMIGRILEEAVDNGVFTLDEVFDTAYARIGNFEPPKYHTRYDTYLDKAILGVQDEFLVDGEIDYAVAGDLNGYVPTHNSRYQNPITGDPEKDRTGNRTKRVYGDPVGLKSSRNTEKGFIQEYHRDNGEVIWDVSSPIYVKGKQWGGFRVGISLDAVKAAKSRLMTALIITMTVILLVSTWLTFFIINLSLGPVRALSQRASDLAGGTALREEIAVTREDEVGELQQALDRLRLSMLIALGRNA